MKFVTFLLLSCAAAVYGTSEVNDCYNSVYYSDKIAQYTSLIDSANQEINLAQIDLSTISQIEPLLVTIENIELNINQDSNNFLQVSAYETASALTVSLLSIGASEVDEKISNINQDMLNYSETSSQTDRLQLIAQIRSSLNDLKTELDSFISGKETDITSYQDSIDQVKQEELQVKLDCKESDSETV